MREVFTVFEIPANTPRSNPAYTDVELEGDRLERVSYLIPTGWHGLAGFAVYHGIEQIYPERSGEWVSGDGIYRECVLRWRMPERRLKLRLRGYNADELYPHKVFIWFTTSDLEEDKLSAIADSIGRVLRWIGL